jgi:hypothetical protein
MTDIASDRTFTRRLTVEGIVVIASRWRFSGGMATFLVDKETASSGWRPSRSDVSLLFVKALGDYL